jgi:hypothetical protein
MEEQSRRYNKSDIDDLEDFRQNWLSELQTSQSLPKTTPEKSPREIIDDAVALYYQAAQYEDDGDMSGATILFRKAYRMDPDLDLHLRELLDEESKNKPRKENSMNLPEFTKDFINEFSNMKVGLENNWNCDGYELLEPESFKQKTHLLDLPDECLSTILQFLVGRRMDFLSLNQFMQTCKYASMKVDQNHYLWSLIAKRSVFGNSEPTSTNSSNNQVQKILESKIGQSAKNSSMPIGKYILKKLSFLRFHGVYVSRCTYFRDGEPDLDGFYKPFHHVVYYRLVMFYEDRQSDQLKCVNFTAALEPQEIFSKIVNFIRNGVSEEGMIHGNVVSELCFEEGDEDSRNSQHINKSGCFMKLTADLKPCNADKTPYKVCGQRITWLIRKKKLIWTGHTISNVNLAAPDRSIVQDFFKTSSRETYPDMTFTPVKLLRGGEETVFVNKKL